jgi:hypothetical protein
VQIRRGSPPWAFIHSIPSAIPAEESSSAPDLMLGTQRQDGCRRSGVSAGLAQRSKRVGSFLAGLMIREAGNFLTPGYRFFTLVLFLARRRDWYLCPFCQEVR